VPSARLVLLLVLLVGALLLPGIASSGRRKNPS
jgi:hypothetical protein